MNPFLETGMPLVRSLTAVTLLFLVVCPRLSAQTTYATITGTVTDSSGGVIKGAVVVATNIETSVTTKTTTNDDGVYTVTQLREGPYLLSVTAAGLRESLATDIMLVSRDVRRIDAKLELGGIEAAVRVTGGNTSIELETARVSDVRTAEQLRTLPLNDPGVWSYLAITPMLTQRGGTYTFAGSKYNQSQFSLDGTTMSDGVGESADRTAGQLHRVVQGSEDRSGEQQRRIRRVSGRSRSFRSRERTASQGRSSTTTRARSSARRIRFQERVRSGVIHFPGLALGGPVVIPRIYNGHGRTFWFVSGETVNGSSASVDLNPTVPIEPWRRGDFSALGRPIRNPFTGEVYADGRIPASALNPVALRIQERFYPLPNSGSSSTLQANNFKETLPRDRSKPYYATTRVDHNFGANDRVFARFTLQQTTNPVWEGNLPAFGMREQFRQDKAVTFSYTRILGSSLVNEFRAATRTTTIRLPGPSRGSTSSNRSACAASRPGCPTSADC